MYDTIELPLAPEAGFSKPVLSVIGALRAPTPEIPFKRNRYYRAVVDLRDTSDIDAILHLQSCNTGSHKIQIVEAGRKCRGEITDTVAKIVNGHPELLGVSRVDACANFVDGPSVRWFAQCVRARCAQWQAQLGTIELQDAAGRPLRWSEMGKRQLGTMYIARRTNCYRVYDKKAERYECWKREKRRHERQASCLVAEKVIHPISWANAPKDFRAGIAKRLMPSSRRMIPFPDFETWFTNQCVGPMTGVVQMRLPGQEEPTQLAMLPQIPRVLTRVERQMGAGRVPGDLDTLEKLFKNALVFNPFERLEFSALGVEPLIDMDDFSPVQFAAGLKFKEWLESGEMTYQQLYAYWNKRRNARAIEKKFAPFVAAANREKHTSISAVDLYDRYRDTISRQLAA